jgi:hypothetical protein
MRCFACGCTDCCGAGWQEAFGVDTPEQLSAELAEVRQLAEIGRAAVSREVGLISDKVTNEESDRRCGLLAHLCVSFIAAHPDFDPEAR